MFKAQGSRLTAIVSTRSNSRIMNEAKNMRSDFGGYVFWLLLLVPSRICYWNKFSKHNATCRNYRFTTVNSKMLHSIVWVNQSFRFWLGVKSKVNSNMPMDGLIKAFLAVLIRNLSQNVAQVLHNGDLCVKV